MPESVIPDPYSSQIPRFTLPPEVTGEKPAVPEPAKDAEPRTPEAKPAAEAAATETEKPATEKPGETETETTGKDLEKPSTRRFERRIDRATRRAAEAQARAEAAERALAEFRKKEVPAPAGAPRIEDFTDAMEYAKALASYEKDNAIRHYQAEQQARATEAVQHRLMQEWEAKLKRADSKYDDFDEVVGELKPTLPWTIATMQAENGEDIAYYLATHMKEANRIASLDPISQIRAIGRLEAVLLAQPAKPKQPSKAPAPITPVTGPAQAASNEIRPNQPFEEYMRIGDKMFRGR